MAIVDQESWDKWVESNTDPYGGCCVKVAEEVMRLLDMPECAEFDCHKIICDADDNVKAGGITGFMAGCVAQMVSKCHSRGEEFRRKWNGDHGVDESEAKGGVVNPAILTITNSAIV